MRVFQKVVETETREVHNTVAGAFRIIDTLECGHVVISKGSIGYALRRKCHDCTQLKQHVDNRCYRTHEGEEVRETWDFTNDCLHRERIPESEL